MTRLFLFIVLAMTFGTLSTPANASYLEFNTKASIGNQEINHVVVVGRPTELGELPLGAAIAKGLQIRSVYRDHNVKFFVATAGTTCDLRHADLNAFIRREFKNVTCRAKSLNRSTLVAAMLELKAIASFDFFGHSSIRYGLHLGISPTKNNSEDWRPFDGPGQLSVGDHASAELRNHFIPGAYAVLHGCNGGHLMAKWLSDIWRIPVAGALTYSHIEQYWNAPDQKGERYFEPVAIQKLSATAPSLGSDVYRLIRTRMKSDTVVYSSKEGFGTYLQGLPIFKFFCSDGNVGRCKLGIARSVLTTVTPVKNITENEPRRHYENVVREFMCPTDQISRSRDRTLFIRRGRDGLSSAQCSDLLIRITSAYRKFQKESGSGRFSNPNGSYMPFEGDSVQCNGLTNCYEKPCYQDLHAPLPTRLEFMAVFCAKGVPIPGSSQSARVLANRKLTSGSGDVRKGASTFVDEYLYLIDAFDALAESDLAYFGR